MPEPATPVARTERFAALLQDSSTEAITSLLGIVFDQASEAILLVDAETGLPVLFNESACRGLGYSAREFARIRTADFQAEHSSSEIDANIRTTLLDRTRSFQTVHRRKDGSLQNAAVTLQPLEYQGRPLICAVWRDITEETRHKAEQAERQKTLEVYNEILGLFGHEGAAIEDRLDGFIFSIVERIATAFGISRVSVWIADREAGLLRCHDLYDLASRTHRSDRSFDMGTFMAEVSAMGNSRYIDAADVREDTRCAMYKEDYFMPKGIISMLDATIVSGGRSIGTVCFEMVGTRREWSPSMVTFICQVADQLGLAYLGKARSDESAARIRSERYLAQAQKVSGTGHWHMDFKRNNLSWSDETYRLFDVKPETPITLDFFLERIHPDDRDAVVVAWNNALRGYVYAIQHRILAGDRTRWVEERAELRFNDDGTPEEALGIVHDITERILAQQELDRYRMHLEELVEARTAALESAKKAAEAASRAKSAFLSNMSHEIRTPMNAVLGFAHLLLREPLSDRQRDTMKRLESSARNLLQIINDILDFSKIEARKMEISIAELSVTDLGEYLQSAVSSQAAAKGLQLEIDLAELPDHVYGDRVRLGQILLNLLSNAVKFTAAGEVRLRARVLDRVTGNGFIARFEVRDTGIGIRPEEMKRLFHAFEQADSSTTRRFGGTGLGLAISRELAELMGGRIGAESEVGRGSLFWVEVPLRRAVPEAVTGAGMQGGSPGNLARLRALAAKGTPPRVLVVEDNVINQEVACEILKVAGLRIDVAQDGAEAVSLSGKAEYDIILMDVQMPVMSGIDATKAIRAREAGEQRAGRRVPIIAMTANAFDEDRQACLGAGMDDHLPKPVEPDVLYGMLLRWLNVAPASR